MDMKYFWIIIVFFSLTVVSSSCCKPDYAGAHLTIAYQNDPVQDTLMGIYYRYNYADSLVIDTVMLGPLLKNNKYTQYPTMYQEDEKLILYSKGMQHYDTITNLSFEFEGNNCARLVAIKYKLNEYALTGDTLFIYY